MLALALALALLSGGAAHASPIAEATPAGAVAALVRPSSAATAATATTAGGGVAHRATDAAHATAAASPLRLGSRGTAVRSLQRTLARLRYLPSGALDGTFGIQTWHAVVAFQGWSGLARDGVVGARTRAALAHASRPVPWSRAEGSEVHIARQVLLLVRGGRVQRAIHVSTGMGGWPTPVGHFRIVRRDPMSWSVPFHSWMPLAQYFYGGYAMHEYPEVPSYPASHGCIRVPEAEARAVWDFGRVGMRLWTRP